MKTNIATVKDTYLRDGITKYTDPFWKFACIKCGHAGWSLTCVDECSKCGSGNIACTNPAHPEHKKSPVS